MKKSKTQKGITLVALILTVVVLLILAVVSINAIQDTQIMGYTSNAGASWNANAQIENNRIGDYNSYLGNYSGIAGSGTGTENNLITFTITLPNNDGVRTYSAVNGTRFIDWVRTSYNTDGWYVASIGGDQEAGDTDTSSANIVIDAPQELGRDFLYGLILDVSTTITAGATFYAQEGWS